MSHTSRRGNWTDGNQATSQRRIKDFSLNQFERTKATEMFEKLCIGFEDGNKRGNSLIRQGTKARTKGGTLRAMLWI